MVHLILADQPITIELPVAQVVTKQLLNDYIAQLFPRYAQAPDTGWFVEPYALPPVGVNAGKVERDFHSHAGRFANAVGRHKQTLLIFVTGFIKFLLPGVGFEVVDAVRALVLFDDSYRFGDFFRFLFLSFRQFGSPFF